MNSSPTLLRRALAVCLVCLALFGIIGGVFLIAQAITGRAYQPALVFGLFLIAASAIGWGIGGWRLFNRRRVELWLLGGIAVFNGLVLFGAVAIYRRSDHGPYFLVPPIFIGASFLLAIAVLVSEWAMAKRRSQ